MPLFRRSAASSTAAAAGAHPTVRDDTQREALSAQQILPALTSIRFLFALGVVLFHLELIWAFPTREYTALIERSRLGVEMFFMLSGFVLSLVYTRQFEERRYSHRRFLVARLARIYPAHIAILGMMGAVAVAALAFGQGFNQANYSLAGFIRTALLVQSWGPSPGQVEWNGPSWSLSAEWFAYLLFPPFALVGLKLRRRPIVLLALSIAIFAAMDVAYRSAFGETVLHAQENLGVMRIVPTFLAGIGLHALSLKMTFSRPVAIAAAATSIAMLLGLMHAGVAEPLIVVAGAVMIFCLAMLSRAGADGPLAHPAALFLGEASYAIYLTHLPLITIWRNAHALRMDGDSRYLLAGWEVAALLALSIVGGSIIHAIWERPARVWIRKRLLSS